MPTNPKPAGDRDPKLAEIAAALAAPFDPRDVKFKPQVVKGNRALAMAYIDARAIQDRLDEVLGVENWQDSYDFLPDGSVVCRLRLKLGERWITKTDVGSPSEQADSGDRIKAAVSDALKRAAVKFGIGRYLYRLPAQWCDYDPVRKQLTRTPQLPSSAATPMQPTTTARQAAPAAGTALPVAERTGQGDPATPVDDAVGRAVVAVTGDRTASGMGASVRTHPRSTNLPGNGVELYRRLQGYEAKLAAQKLCERGALIRYVSRAGTEAGYPPNICDWTGPAISFAVSVVREFERTRGTPTQTASDAEVVDQGNTPCQANNPPTSARTPPHAGAVDQGAIQAAAPAPTAA